MTNLVIRQFDQPELRCPVGLESGICYINAIKSNRTGGCSAIIIKIAANNSVVSRLINQICSFKGCATSNLGPASIPLSASVVDCGSRGRGPGNPICDSLSRVICEILELWNCDCRQNADDDNYDDQFDQGETGLSLMPEATHEYLLRMGRSPKVGSISRAAARSAGPFAETGGSPLPQPRTLHVQHNVYCPCRNRNAEDGGGRNNSGIGAPTKVGTMIIPRSNSPIGGRSPSSAAVRSRLG